MTFRARYITAVKRCVWNNCTLQCKIDFNRFLSWQDKRVLYKGKTITMKFCGRGMLEALATFRKSIVLENTVLLAIGCCFFRIWNLECIDTVYLAFFCVLPKFHTLSWSSGLVLLRVNAFNSHARIISKRKWDRILHSSGTQRGSSWSTNSKNIDAVGLELLIFSVKSKMKEYTNSSGNVTSFAVNFRFPSWKLHTGAWFEGFWEILWEH